MKPAALLLALVILSASVLAIDIAPSISISANPGTTVDSSATITAVSTDALDNAGIVTMQLFQDGVLNQTKNCLGATSCFVSGTFTYISAQNHTYVATSKDNGGNTVTSSALTVVFKGANTAPQWVSLPATLSLPEDGNASLNLPLFATDAQDASTSLTYSILSQTNTSMAACSILTNKTLFCSAATPNAFGSEVINLSVSDGTLSDTRLMNVTVVSVNDPVLVAGTLANMTFNENSNASQVVSTGFSDVDNASLLYTASFNASVISNVTFATVGGVTTATVIGSPNKNGNTTVIFFASDGLLSANQSINVQIIPVDMPPLLLAPISNQTWLEDTNTSFNISTFWNETDGQAIGWTVSGNTNITITIDNATGLVTLVPAGNFSGSETVIFTASDGTLTAASNPVVLNVTPVNDAPFATGALLANVTTLEDTNDTSLNLATIFADIDSPDLNWTANASGPFLVSIDQASGAVNIAPFANQSGNGVITFTATDGELSSGPSNTVNVTVLPVNDAPFQVATIPNITFAEDATASLDLLPFFGDIDNATLLYTAVSGNPNILVTTNNSVINLSSAPDFFGNGTLTITASDGQFTVTANIVVVVVDPVNDAPVAVPLTNATLAEEGNLLFDLAPFFTDVDNTTLLFSTAFVDTSKVNVTMSGSVANITGNLDFVGNTTIQFTASDGSLSVTEPMTVTFTNVNDAPALATPIPNQTWSEDTVLQFNISSFWTDVDGDVLTWTASPTTNIAVSINNSNGIVTLTPALNFNGTETVTFTASDGTTSTPSNPVDLTVNAVTDPPVLAFVINNRTFIEDGNDTFNILTAFTDPDSPDLNWSVTGATNVLVFINNETGEVNLSAVPDFNGVETLTFIASDGAMTASSNTVNVTVVPAPDVPVFNPALANQSGSANASFTYDIDATDADGDTVTFNNANTGDFTIDNATGVITFTPTNQTTIAVDVNACDQTSCTPGTFNIVVGPFVPASAPASSGGGGGGGGSSHRGSSSGTSGNATYNITTPVALPVLNDIDNTASGSTGSSSNDTVVTPTPTPASTPTGAVVAVPPTPQFGIGMTIVSGILIFGLAGYAVVRRLTL